MYEVIKTINGNQYRYEQESYREGGKVRTRSKYLGPVKPKRRIISELLIELREMMKMRPLWVMSPEEQTAYEERLAKEYAERDHINDILSGRHISLEELQEVIDRQNPPAEREDTPEEAAAIATEVEAVPEFASEVANDEGGATAEQPEVTSETSDTGGSEAKEPNADG